MALNVRYQAALWIEDADRLATELRDLCPRYERHATLRDTIDNCKFERGWLAHERGDRDETRTAMTGIRYEARRELAQAYLLALDGKLDEAARRATAFAAEPASSWWMRIAAADASSFAVDCLVQLGREQDAILAARKVLRLLDDEGLPVANIAFIRRRVARTNLQLARLLATTNAVTSRSHARDALVWYRTAGGYPQIVAELEGLLTDSR
jgi:hypothetical protein